MIAQRKAAEAGDGMQQRGSDVNCLVALDFETADYERDSACALALVRVERGQIVRRDTWLIRPPRRAFAFTYVHGITWQKVARRPTFGELWPEISTSLSDAEACARIVMAAGCSTRQEPGQGERHSKAADARPCSTSVRQSPQSS